MLTPGHKGLVVFCLPSTVLCCVVHSLRSRLSPLSLIPCCPIFVAKEIRVSSPLLLQTSCSTIYFHSVQFPMWDVLSTLTSLSTGMKGQEPFLLLHKSCSNQVAMETIHLQQLVCFHQILRCSLIYTWLLELSEKKRKMIRLRSCNALPTKIKLCITHNVKKET